MNQLKKLAGDGEASEQEQLEMLIKALGTPTCPNLVMGFRVGDAKNAIAQLKRLEGVLNAALEGKPEIAKRVKRTASESGQFLQFTVDESIIPWDKALEDDDLDQEAGRCDSQCTGW